MRVGETDLGRFSLCLDLRSNAEGRGLGRADLKTPIFSILGVGEDGGWSECHVGVGVGVGVSGEGFISWYIDPRRRPSQLPGSAGLELLQVSPKLSRDKARGPLKGYGRCHSEIHPLCSAVLVVRRPPGVRSAATHLEGHPWVMDPAAGR